MTYEKSCGAVIVKHENGGDKYLLVLNKKPGSATGHWGFPKGHCEGRECEYETAAREIMEEVGIKVVFVGGKRTVSTYSPIPGVTKDAVYFYAVARDTDVKVQQSEISQYKWCSYDEAMNLITHDKTVLKKLVD
ncbi:MAG: NUDIX domain-containing protein [Ruminococcaceae bacterium]|nr:NUDIX domain-containing protein [Oscillospiraceae bacterium]